MGTHSFHGIDIVGVSKMKYVSALMFCVGFLAVQSSSIGSSRSIGSSGNSGSSVASTLLGIQLLQLYCSGDLALPEGFTMPDLSSIEMPTFEIPEGFVMPTMPTFGVPEGFVMPTMPTFEVPEGFVMPSIPEDFVIPTLPSMPEDFDFCTWISSFEMPTFELPEGFEMPDLSSLDLSALG